MGPLGVQEMIAIFLVALLLFGPKKLPELGRTLGKALSEFRRAKNELKNTFETHLHELEREARVEIEPVRLDSGPTYSHTSYSSSNYSDPYEPSTSPTRYSDPYEPDRTSSNPYGSTSTPYEEPAAVAPAMPPVEGTVSRSNGVQPVSHAPIASGEEHQG